MKYICTKKEEVMFANFNFPSFFSTVTPGQLPTYWFEPVSALNNVVLPQLGLPANAILIDIFSLQSAHMCNNYLQLHLVLKPYAKFVFACQD